MPQGSVSVSSQFSPVTSKPGVRPGSSSVDHRGQAPSDLLLCLQLLPPDYGLLVSGRLLPPGPFICIPGRKEKGMSGPLPSGFRLPGWTLLLRSQGTGTFPAWVAVACLTGCLSCWYRSEGRWPLGGQPPLPIVLQMGLYPRTSDPSVLEGASCPVSLGLPPPSAPHTGVALPVVTCISVSQGRGPVGSWLSASVEIKRRRATTSVSARAVSPSPVQLDVGGSGPGPQCWLFLPPGCRGFRSRVKRTPPESPPPRRSYGEELRAG